MRSFAQILFFSLLLSYLANRIFVHHLSDNQIDIAELIVSLPDGLTFSTEKNIVAILESTLAENLVSIDKIDKKEQIDLLKSVTEINNLEFFGVEDFLYVVYKRTVNTTDLAKAITTKFKGVEVSPLINTSPSDFSKRRSSGYGYYMGMLAIFALFISIYHRFNQQSLAIQLLAGVSHSQVVKSIMLQYLYKGLKIGALAMVFYNAYLLVTAKESSSELLNKLLIGSVSIISSVIIVSLIIGMIERNKFFNQLNNS